MDVARADGALHTFRQVEGTAEADVDQTGDAAIDLVRGIGLVDVDAGDEISRQILQRDAAARAREDFIAIERGAEIGQAADHDGVDFAVVARDLDARNSLQRVGHGVVRQLADVLGHDGIDELRGVLLDLLRADEAAADGVHDHLVENERGFVIRCTGRRRGGRVFGADGSREKRKRHDEGAREGRFEKPDGMPMAPGGEEDCRHGRSGWVGVGSKGRWVWMSSDPAMPFSIRSEERVL